MTKNKLTLAEPFTVAGVEPDDLMLTACLAASRKKKGIDAIDKAFLKSLRYYPRAKSVLSKYKVIEFTPFDPVSKKVSAVVESPQGERIICVKGAPLFVLKTVTEDHPVPEEIEQAYKNKVADFATRGYRSLGVARKRGEGQWEILGIMPCMDPPRYDTAKTINEAKTLGLSIKMLTGDAVGIARETSRQLGLGTNVYNAERLGLSGGGTMPGSEVYDFVEAADGFAEVFPQHKYNVVEILQQRGYLVAMTGDGVNDAPSLKKADTGIAVEGASDAARSAADIVFLAPGLSAIIDALKTSRQIFHRMYAYVVYRIALSLHLEIFLGLWIAILNESLNIELVVFIAIFADIATLAIAYDNAPFSKTPVKWNLPRLWGMSVLLGIVLAIGTWICLTTLFVGGTNGQVANGGIVQNFGIRDEVLFLQISLSENWLIFITRADGPFWASIPSWQLTGAILIVDIMATFFCLFGFFVGGQTSIVAVVRIWLFSFGVFCVMGGVYYLLQGSTGFDSLMHGKSPKKNQKQRSLEDFGLSILGLLIYYSMLTLSSCLITTCLHSAREERVNHDRQWFGRWGLRDKVLEGQAKRGDAHLIGAHGFLSIYLHFSSSMADRLMFPFFQVPASIESWSLTATHTCVRVRACRCATNFLCLMSAAGRRMGMRVWLLRAVREALVCTYY